jgi:hypothetical protein
MLDENPSPLPPPLAGEGKGRNKAASFEMKSNKTTHNKKRRLKNEKARF